MTNQQKKQAEFKQSLKTVSVLTLQRWKRACTDLLADCDTVSARLKAHDIIRDITSELEARA